MSQIEENITNKSQMIGKEEYGCPWLLGVY